MKRGKLNEWRTREGGRIREKEKVKYEEKH